MFSACYKSDALSVEAYSFIQKLFIEYLHVSGSVLGARDIVVDESAKSLPSCTLYFSQGREPTNIQKNVNMSRMINALRKNRAVCASTGPIWHLLRTRCSVLPAADLTPVSVLAPDSVSSSNEKH